MLRRGETKNFLGKSRVLADGMNESVSMHVVSDNDVDMRGDEKGAARGQRARGERRTCARMFKNVVRVAILFITPGKALA
jgi:hypothetical protein